MSIVWDLAVVGVIVFFAFAARNRGFLYTVARLVGTVAVIVLALLYSRPIAGRLYDDYLEQRVLIAIEEHIGAFGEPGVEAFAAGLDSILAEMPPVVSQALHIQSGETLERWYNAFISSQAPDLAASLADAVVAPMTIALVQSVVFCVMFALGMALVHALAGMLRGVNKIPLLGSVNALLGGALGALQGGVYVFVGAAVLWLLLIATGDTLPFISFDTVEQTFLLKHFFAAGPWADGMLTFLR